MFAFTNKIKLKTKKIIFSISALLLIFSNYSYARNIGEINNFRIKYGFRRTEYVTKTTNLKSYAVNLKESAKLSPIRIVTRVINIDGYGRSAENRLTAGNRAEFELHHQASSGFKYALQLGRENWWDGSIYIDGSWSPDPR